MAEVGAAIVDVPLPEAMDFDVLKEQGIARLKALAGNVWTNFNDSDPGVTTLEQLCYALTEVAYCADFPVEDLLAREDGSIAYAGRFFAPEDILTCAPVTIDDYRKLVLDRLPAVRAIYLEAERLPRGLDGTRACSGRYASRVCLRAEPDPGASVQATVDQVLDAIHMLLNQHRNVGELFLRPAMLEDRTIVLGGTVRLQPAADPAAVYDRLVGALAEYAAPLPVQRGYGQLRDGGLAADAIFNGPRLDNGWIAGAAAPGPKCEEASLFALHQLLGAIDGVAQVVSLCFLGNDADLPAVPIGATEVARFALDRTRFVLQSGTATAGRAPGARDVSLDDLRRRHQAAPVEAQVDVAPPHPHGRYRNVADYCSIQNTFPDVYRVGYNSPESDQPDYDVAVSRQFKGYLMVFDQLLANQFAQLANVDTLFSWQVDGPVVPARPGPSYFCQDLYDVPAVKPLLLGNEAYHFQFDSTLERAEVEREAWRAYRQEPHNPYMQGLRALTESEGEAARRRDAVLTHLMARHGDDAGAYDDMIRAGHAYGSDAATRAAIKTIWLRHYQQLSYRRGCGFNVLQAAALQAPDTVHPHASGADAGGAGRTILPREPAERDFRDFSTFELKAGLLLGLPTHLQALAQILWAVLAQRDFGHWLAHGGRWRVPYRLPGSDLAIVVVRKDGHETARLDAGTQPLLDIVGQPGSALCVEDFRSHAQQLDWLGRRQGCILVEHGLLAPDADPVPPAYALQATLLFPGYVRRVQQGAFGGFVDTLVDLHWPAHVGLTRHVPSYRFLRAFIPFFVAWHNALAHGNDTEAAAQVARLLKLPALPRKDAHAG